MEIRMNIHRPTRPDWMYFTEKWGNRRELTVFGLAVILVSAILILVGTIVLIAWQADMASCYSTGNAIHRAVKYPNLLVGCVVHTRHGWIPIDNWRGLN